MSDQRTEAPTPRRLAEARRRGQPVGRSHELVMAATLGTGVIALTALLPAAATALATLLRTAAAELGSGGDSPARILDRVGEGIGQTIGLTLPLAVAVLVAGVLANLAGGGLVLSFGSIRFDPSRLDPIRGMRRLADRAALERLGIALAKLAILAAVAWQVVASRIDRLVAVDGAPAGIIAAAAMAAIFELGATVTVLLAAVALIDFVIQRRRAQGGLRMTKDEVRRETKDQEGDPLIRGLRRRRARQLAFARMMDALPTADVVVVNPIHLAVALRYDSLTMGAPRIVAKGQRLMAARIRDIAAANGVPIVEDRPLARALFSRPLGSEVPSHLYRAVARILVFVHQSRFGRRHAAPPGDRRAGGRGTGGPRPATGSPQSTGGDA